MAYTSMQVFVSDGTLQSVSFGISFLSVEHLHYYVNETEITTTSGELGVFVDGVDEYGVTLTAAVPAGAIFKVLRKTPRDKVPHVFATGAALFTALTTDANNEYLLYIVQETFEQSGNGPFPNTTTLDGTELLYVNVGGIQKQITVSNFLDQAPDVVLDGFKQDLANNTDTTKGAALVGYKGRTQAEKNNDIISVKDFGAVADCVYNIGTDNTAAFQAAIDYCLANSRALYVPSGDYLIKGSLFINGTRNTGSQSTFYMYGEIASDAITHSPSTVGGIDGVIVSKTNLIFDSNNDNLFEIKFDNFFFENVRFENITVCMPQNGANFKTSTGFSVEKDTGNYVSKLIWSNVNCYGMKKFIRFFRTNDNPANDKNYFGFTWIEKCNSFKTDVAIEFDNVNMNTLTIDNCIFHEALVDGGLHFKGSAGFVNIRNTHFEGCEPAAFNFTASNWNVSLGLDNVSAESTGKVSGYGYIKPFTPTFGYSGLKVFVSNWLYPPAFMPNELRLPFGAEITSQCPVRVSGHGWIAKTPDTITPVVSNNSSFNQTEKYSLFLSDLNVNTGRNGKKVINGLAGNAYGVGRSPSSSLLPTSLRGKTVGINTNSLNQNVDSVTVSTTGYLYGSWAASCTDTNNGLSAGTFTVADDNINILTGFTWSAHTGLFTFVTPVTSGQSITTVDIGMYQSAWRTPVFVTNEPEYLTASEAASVMPATVTTEHTIANGATTTFQEFGQLNVPYALKVKFTVNNGALGYYDVLLRGNGPTASRVATVITSSLSAGVSIAQNGFYTDENLYKIDVANSYGGSISVSVSVEYLS